MAWVRVMAEDGVRDRWLDSRCILKLEPSRFADRTLAGWARAESRMTLVWRPRVQKCEMLFVETVTTAGEPAGWGRGRGGISSSLGCVKSEKL